MEPSKIVYVKNYTRGLRDVTSEPTDGYLKYPIYKLPMELSSFDETVIERWHPLVKILEINMDGNIFFEIHGMEFRVRESQTEDQIMIISTSFQELKYNKGKMLNNLNLFQKFQKSFKIYELTHSLIGFSGEDSNYSNFEITNIHYSIKPTDRKNILHILIKSDGFADFHLNYMENDDGRYEYIGIGYGEVEVWYDYDYNIDLENQIEDLKLKIDLVEFIKDKLYDIYGIGVL